jgi:DNA topoisomerase-2
MPYAKITKNSRGEEYTRVTFTPDLKCFGMTAIDPDTVSMLKKRVYDMACTAKDVEVYLNDKRLKIKSFKQYIELYLNSAAEAAAQAKQSVVYERIMTAGRSALPSQKAPSSTSRSPTRYLL